MKTIRRFFFFMASILYPQKSLIPSHCISPYQSWEHICHQIQASRNFRCCAPLLSNSLVIYLLSSRATIPECGIVKSGDIKVAGGRSAVYFWMLWHLVVVYVYYIWTKWNARPIKTNEREVEYTIRGHIPAGCLPAARIVHAKYYVCMCIMYLYVCVCVCVCVASLTIWMETTIRKGNGWNMLGIYICRNVVSAFWSALNGAWWA